MTRTPSPRRGAAVEKDLRTIPAWAASRPRRAWCARDRRCKPEHRHRRRPGRDQRRPCRDVAHRHGGRLRPVPAQAEPVAAPGADRGQARDRCAAGPGGLGRTLTVPGNGRGR